MGTVPGLLIMALLLACNALFVAAEFALVALDRPAIEARAAEGSRVHRRLLAMLRNLTRSMSGYQFGITAAALLLGFGAEPTVARLLTGEAHPTGLSVAIAIAVATALHLVVGEQVPKYLALAAPEATARRLLPVMVVYGGLVRPVVAVLNRSADAVVRRLGVEPRAELTATRTRDELEELIRTSSGEGGLDPAEVTLLTRSIRFGDKTAADALIPRVAVEALQQEDTAADLLERSARTGRSRYPVFAEDLDDIVGVVHVKSVVGRPAATRESTPVAELMLDVLAVPETRPLEALLGDMRRQRVQMAVVVDEHGGTEGIITMEDLLEEILGQIDDEHDPQMARTRVEAKGSTIVAGRLNLDEVAEATGFAVPDGPYETLAGFALARLGRLPEPGEMIVEAGWRIEVVAMDGRRIAALRVVAP